MSEQLDKYNRIMNEYRSGELGDTNLPMKSILENIGEEEIFNEMSIEDIDFLINNSTGMIKYMFLLIKNKKMVNSDNVCFEEHQYKAIKKSKTKKIDRKKH